jgi:predicted metal-binding membrane protein
MSSRSAALRSRIPLGAIERGQLLVIVCLAVLTVAAWGVTIHQARTMDMPMGIALRAAADVTDGAVTADPMAGMNMAVPSGVESVAASGMSSMGADTWSWSGFATFLIAWAVMMAAMMFPAVAPLLLILNKMSGQRTNASFVPTWFFAAGYLAVWSLAGIATWALVQIGIDLGSRLGSGARETWAPVALGTTLVVAGIYQFSPLKATCLRQCQSPLGFLMSHWRSGRLGAVRMGIKHGAFCLGCCWALFAVLVAAGVMSLAWMLLLTLIVFTEKVLRTGPWGQRLVGGAFLALGLLVAAGAFQMPWSA